MPMTAAECRARAKECMDLAEITDATGREQLQAIAAKWLNLAETAPEQPSKTVRIGVADEKPP
jgi:hypothetical protein